MDRQSNQHSSLLFCCYGKRHDQTQVGVKMVSFILSHGSTLKEVQVRNLERRAMEENGSLGCLASFLERPDLTAYGWCHPQQAGPYHIKHQSI